ncbi:MAG: phosphate ABC transporter permease subunit PstC [Kofleriaceae bacterium]|nr:MAG: phosphate ABC transporter permease subunit PstC [Kofleriaceae bacterium]MBZ0230775.1 phosphate ABC transporter permease subunit PstC [Kofleriaceae bacterium]
MDGPASDVALPAVSQRTAVKRASGFGERIIETMLAGCGAVSVFVTIGIVLVLVFEAAAFFEEVSLAEFFGDTQWTPLFRDNQHFGIWPLVMGTLVTSAIAMAVALPLGLLAAIYLSEYAAPKTRKVIKPALEILAGVPTIVYGYFALTIVTPFLQGYIPGLAGGNMLSPGIVMGIMIIPLVSSLSEDAIYAVPDSLREGALALGAGKLPTILRVIVPSAWSGIAAAMTLAVSRAIGETMIVAIAAGNQANFTYDAREPAETMTAYIVNISKGDTPNGTLEYRTIFAVGLMLFVMTLVMNLISYRLSRRLRAQSRA